MGEVAPALDRLEARVEALLADRERLEAELTQLREENARYGRERQELRTRLDALIDQVDAAVLAVPSV